VRRNVHFVCRRCDYQCAKWLGRCPECGEWGSIAEHIPDGPSSTNVAPPLEAVPYSEISTQATKRIPTTIGEFDRVLGGGLVPGGVVLIGGEPGIGKSTLLLQAASGMALAGRPVLYVSGEESAAQVKLRGERLGLDEGEILIVAGTEVDRLIATALDVRPAVMIVDSIQAVRCHGVESVPGSVAQVREAAARFVDHAKSTATPLLLVGHVTKEDRLAGPRTLEHLVDTVIHFEGDRHHSHRLLRALKNRFGATDELGVFRMEESGLAEVSDPGDLFLGRRVSAATGAAVLPAIVGRRPLLVEVQALVGEVAQGSPRRTAVGVDHNRLAMILAVVQQNLGVELSNRDVFANVAGGVGVGEPGADLALAAAILSSVRRRPLPSRWVVMGEIGLTGEVRPVSRVTVRLREAARLGFEAALAPGGARVQVAESFQSHGVSTVAEAAKLLFASRGAEVSGQIG
jgi:DNA repair protein RadA/Sms